MSTTEHREPVVVLHPDQVETLRDLLGTVEDWLLHCGGEALDDLAAFLTNLSWAPSTAPEQLATDLVNDLGEQAVALATALRETALRETALRGAGIATGSAP